VADWFRARAWRSWRDRALAVALAVVGGVGCDLGERCLVESRSLHYEAETSREGRVGRASLELTETRGAETASWVVWHVRVTPFVTGARRVVLREGPPDAPGRVLYDFVVVNAVPASGVVTQVFTRTPYAGEVPSAELWELVQRQPVSFEILFDGDARPFRVGPLLRTGSSDWQDACS
jgi:hypothetical protein